MDRLQTISNNTKRPSWLWRAIKFLFWLGFTLGLLGLATLTTAGFFGRYGWHLDAFSHFRFQYTLIALAMLAVAFTGKKRLLSFGTAVVAAVNLAFILPLIIATPTAEAGSGSTLRLLSANVLYGNDTPEKVVDLIDETDPDIVVLVEMTYPHKVAMSALWDSYPYVVDSHDGNIILSRIPLEGKDVIRSPWMRPDVVARFVWDGKPFTVVGVHPTTPLSERGWQRRNEHLQQIAAYVQQENQPTIVAGDFNISPFSPYFADLLAKSGLENGRVGQGINTTWPNNSFSFMRIPIDHFLATPDITVQSLETGPYVGSDHRPLIIDFSLK